MSADSVSIFAEGTFEEQILELANYLARPLAEDARPAFVAPFQELVATAEGQKPIEEDQERRRKAISAVLDAVEGLGDGSDKEIEGFFNLLLSHLLALFPLDAPETRSRLDSLLATIASSSSQSHVRYRVLSTLYNIIPRKSSLRLPVYRTLIEIASANEELDALKLSPSDVEKALSEWDVPSEEKSAILKSLVDAFVKSDQPTESFKYQLAYVRSIPPSSPAAEGAAVDAITTALRLPAYFDFDPLLRLDAVVAAKSHELFPLLQIFLSGGLGDYNAWSSAHADVLTKHNLDAPQLERKIRLLTLTALAFQNIGRDVPYEVIASSLQVDATKVEAWAIDAIRAGLISGKLSQTAKTLHVIRATARGFERDQWEQLEKRLQAWKTGLASVLEVVAESRKKTTRGSAEKEAPPAVAAAPATTEAPPAVQAVAA